MLADINTDFNNGSSLSQAAYGKDFTPLLPARCYVENGLLLFGEPDHV
jgi:hypothetical protein